MGRKEDKCRRLENLICNSFNNGDVLITLKYKKFKSKEENGAEARAFASKLARAYKNAGKEPAYILANTEKCSRIAISGWKYSQELKKEVRKIWKISKIEEITDINTVARYMGKDFINKYLISKRIWKKEAGNKPASD